LCRVELLLLAKVVDLGADLAVHVDQLRRDILLLDLDIGVVEGASYEALQGADCVLEVGNLLRLSSLAEVPALGPEANERSSQEVRRRSHKAGLHPDGRWHLRCSPVGDFVGDLYDASVSMRAYCNFFPICFFFLGRDGLWVGCAGAQQWGP
jgi:hypothetical protein